MSKIRQTPELYQSKVLNFAHRGASRHAPENTLAAFRLAREMGADGVELDVQASRDGEAVVIHDFTVDRTTNGQGRVKDKTLAKLRELDAGSWFDARFAGQRIPTLEEVILEVGHQLLLNIELKARAFGSADLVAEVVRLIEDHNLVHRVIVSSFNPLALRRVKKLNPRIPTGLLYYFDLPAHLLRTLLLLLADPDALHPQKHLVAQDYMDWARERGYRVNVWTVDEPAEMKRLIALGVDGIITNRPDVLTEILDIGD
ncbi:MAG: glycerophosphodiester phosphodiesterase [Chloroflexi bacterium]|nr:glycerophosphodiester phosphodiesterase [Chloroflexota bacterium]